MNRIYQGKVTNVQIQQLPSSEGSGVGSPAAKFPSSEGTGVGQQAKGKGKQPKPEWIDLPNWEAALWDHHALFQDAVNYYVVCLLALAQPGNAVYPIREKLDAKNAAGGDDELMVWRSFRRRGAMRRGLRDSVVPYLCSDKPDATPEDCFAAALAGNECAQSDEGRKRLDAGLTQLLAKCTGAAGCKQAAPVFLPRFAKPSYQGSYGEDTTTLLRENEGARLPFILHDPATNATSPTLDQFSVHSIALPNEKKPKFIGREAVRKLHSMVAEWRKRQPTAENDWQRLDSAINKLADDFEMPGYAATSAKNDVKFRLFAMFIFQYVERSEFALDLLRSTTKKPDANEAAPEAKTTAPGSGDPIRVARGARGYVFRAFTSQPCWGGDGKGSPEWISFDFAAFEEALKALHQVDAKADERRKLREQKQTQHDYQRGRVKKMKSTGGEGEGVRPPVLAGDPRIARLEELLSSDLAAEYEMSEGVSVKYGLNQRTIRGFRDVRKKWNDALGEDAEYSDAAKKKLWELLTDYKIENAQTMGSPVLFDAMVEEKNWIIWREPTAELMAMWRKAAKLPDEAEFAKDPLQALTDERELIEEIDRLRGPIRFTPADPEHSRRQFYFSDVTALDKKNRLRHDRQTLETEIALKTDGKWSCKWVEITFTAPRLLRDQLNNDSSADAVWQQAIMAALGLKTGLLKNGKPASFADCAAVALMPEVRADGSKHILLNFPVTLDGEAIAKQLGKAARWDALQFGGADKESYWLRWPATWIDEKKERKKAPPAPWWRSNAPFGVLSVDLGQRDAGAFALLEASSGNAPKPQSRRIGSAEGKTWWATVRATGMLRLPGENAFVMRDGQWQEEFSGSRGRNLVAGEWDEARDICEQLGFQPNKMLGTDEHRRSFPELNNELLYALRRAQARLARLQSWSCVAYEEPDEKKRAAFEKRRTRIKEQIIEAISEREAEEKKSDKERGQESPARSAWLSEVKLLVEKQAWGLVAGRIKTEIGTEREIIERELLRIADRIQPLRGRRWEWAEREDGSHCHVLRQTKRGTDDRKKMLAGQRGLSMQRIEQLESLRQRCQSLNRALMQEPGVPAKLGRSKRGIELPDPCPELLDRLEALKEQRVNQTAHLILAQAMGVRLKAHERSDAERTAQDIHGEYERMPGREPVDFLVLENLDRYLASQGRSRGENSKLMKWSHRAILAKLKQLCEPYGLRVLETPAAYSSRFCSLTGVAGFRAVELTPEDAKEFRWKKHLDRLADPERFARLDRDERAESQRVKALFEMLEQMNAGVRAANSVRPKWRTLLAPVAGGPMFVPASAVELCESKKPKTGNNGTVVLFSEVGGRRPVVGQADLNAAINLGLRAIAAPDADDIHLRIRAKREGESFVVRAENAREKARWKDKSGKIAVPKEAERKKLLADAHLNFFADLGNAADFDRAGIDDTNGYASGRGIWGTIKNGKDWKRVQGINAARVKSCGLTPPAEWENDADDIPK